MVIQFCNYHGFSVRKGARDIVISADNQESLFPSSSLIQRGNVQRDQANRLAVLASFRILFSKSYVLHLLLHHLLICSYALAPSHHALMTMACTCAGGRSRTCPEPAARDSERDDA